MAARALYYVEVPGLPRSRHRVFFEAAEAEGFRARMARTAAEGDRAAWRAARVVLYLRLRRTNPLDH